MRGFVTSDSFILSFNSWRGIYGAANVPDCRNLTITRNGVRARIPGEWTSRRKGIKVHGPDGQSVTYANHRRVVENVRGGLS